MTTKTEVYSLLERASYGNKRAVFVERVIMFFIFLNVTFAVLETEPYFDRNYLRIFFYLDLLAGLIFLTEYILRVWVADLHSKARGRSAFSARINYMMQPMAIIDFLAVLPLLLSFVLPLADWKALIVLRLLRFLKIARYSPALRSLSSALSSERKAILASLIIIFGSVLISATLMFIAEREVQPDKFGSIPSSMWWAFATLTTVGYGDVVPVTSLGRFVASLSMLAGYCLFALPVGIISSAFAREIKSRDFVVSWSMVAEVPMFSSLTAAEIKDVAHLLHSHSIGTGEALIMQGEAASKLYIIASGKLAVLSTDGSEEQQVFEAGDSFGDLSLKKKRSQQQTIRALEPTQLLVLDRSDLRKLMKRKPDLAHKLREVTKREP
ncbi:cyclic nucleotide-gated ion channel [Polycladidibacter stylochi]|uniref:cyclic nucleotide-gated ion channel n=1 Tax=Polycladidibacter stylochi TaxID=1807766 RepID=UPI00082AE6F8|nr:cyclic nucleotide-gated ion channel [Pseudovibrio stylochi]